MEEFGLSGGRQNSLGSSGYASSATLSPYGDNVSAPRYAGVGLAGSGATGKTSLDGPQMKRQDSAPGALNGDLARAAELVNGSHAQYSSTVGAGAQNRPLYVS